MNKKTESITNRLAGLNEHELRRQLVAILTEQKLGLVWERDAITRDEVLNANVVLPEFIEELSCRGIGKPTDPYRNLIIEGDNFDSLRLLKTTHANKIRVIYIDPPYNTGNKDWVYNDSFVGQNDRWRHSQWLEFLYQRLELARDLLTPDGVILVSINDENRSRLELLMDEVFPGMRLGSLVWRTRDTTSAKGANFSDVHEHVLMYAGAGFAFQGREKQPTKYKNPDNDPDGPWNGDPLTLAFDRFERQNLFYPLHNTSTDVWYPCDESRVWVYATESRVKDVTSLSAETMEAFVAKKRILFPDQAPKPTSGTKKQLESWIESSRVVVWETMEDLLKAIDIGDIPVTPKRKRPLLTRDTPNLEFWVGKQVCFGRPLFKKHWKFLRSHVNPLSSWIARLGEDDDENVCGLRSPQAGEGTEIIQGIFGSKVFQYPKPLLLIEELLSQATKPGDIVLDFFAGSGTTGQAVLELNAKDGGQRRFILCSNSEALANEPTKNICRDVTAERIRRISNGYGKTKGLGGDFAYLKVTKIPPEDARMDFTPEQAFHLLNLRSTLSIKAYPPGPVKAIHSNDELSIVYLPEVNAAAIKALIALPQSRIAVYSARPQTVAEKLEASGKEGNSYAIGDAILSGQVGNMTITMGVAE
jgi:adenine-specific DNA-methyltransferase